MVVASFPQSVPCSAFERGQLGGWRNPKPKQPCFGSGLVVKEEGREATEKRDHLKAVMWRDLPREGCWASFSFFLSSATQSTLPAVWPAMRERQKIKVVLQRKLWCITITTMTAKRNTASPSTGLR